MLSKGIFIYRVVSGMLLLLLFLLVGVVGYVVIVVAVKFYNQVYKAQASMSV